MKRFFLALALAMTPAVASAGTWAHTTSDLHLRAAPGVHGARMAVMPQGASVYVHGCDTNHWCSVTYGNHHGFASGRHMMAEPRVVHRHHDRDVHIERSPRAVPSDAAIAGAFVGAAAVLVAGPAGALLPSVIAGGIVGGAAGQIATDIQHDRAALRGRDVCRFTMPSTGRVWYETCPGSRRW